MKKVEIPRLFCEVFVTVMEEGNLAHANNFLDWVWPCVAKNYQEET